MPDERFDTYLKRIWLPKRFTARYLLPLLSAIATCSHDELLAFPASDIVQYRKLITGQKQYVVTGGVRRVQEVLTQGVSIRFRTRVRSIEPRTSGLEVVYETIDVNGLRSDGLERFDRIITAVPPNVVADLFEPSRSQLSMMPVRTVETIVHRVRPATQDFLSGRRIDRIILKTTHERHGLTEATHLRADGIAVTSCPISPLDASNEILSRSTFARTLRTSESRQIVQRVLSRRGHNNSYESDNKSWRIGGDGLYVVGAWAFDGIPLLEGAVSSAVDVARRFDIEIPWELGKQRT